MAEKLGKSKGEQTRNHIRLAIVRIEKGRPSIVDSGRKISISAVAEEAGVSRATIHNRYPDLAERIRGGVNKNVIHSKNEKNKELKTEKIKSKKLREALSKTKSTLAEVSSINARLLYRNKELEKINANRNVLPVRFKHNQ